MLESNLYDERDKNTYLTRQLSESREEIARLRKALDSLYQHSIRSRFKADAYLWEQAKAALEAS